MKKISAILLATCFATPAAPALAKDTKHIPDYFPLRVGDWWKYRSTYNGNTSEFTITVVKKDGDLIEVDTTSTNLIQDWYKKGNGLVEVHKEAYPKNNMVAEFKPVKKWLKNPLVVGDKWEWSGTGMMNTQISSHDEVKAAVDVAVPAGKFSTMEVDSKVNQGGADVAKTYFYADGIGLVKSMTDSGGVKSTTELIDYSFKKK